jgi:hydrogenase maturation protein HypF
MSITGRRIEIRGVVQGVGFRPFVYQQARRNDIMGRVTNDSSGVTVDAFADAPVLDRFVEILLREAPPAARITSIEWRSIPVELLPGFTIENSVASRDLRVSIPADLATCDDCLREMSDPSDRRYRYPFINCTNCGPRYSIVHGAPYDRVMTSMARFQMCPRCQAEYDDPADRRFHAQPNACALCGPKLMAMTPARNEITTLDPIRFASRALRAGLIVAIKGLGGFHLACDATSSSAVQRLRERKRRDTKPFAVMVRDLADAERLASLSEDERALLTSVERPIVLARAAAPLAAREAGNPLIGLFLPYTPLHHLLLKEAIVPLVMTSGNVSDEPMVTSNNDAFAQLGSVADVFLVHDRDIVTRVDDSVVRVIAGKPATLRRARGYVPRAIDPGHVFAEPVLAVGAHLKNTFCLARGNEAFLGPHIGDLESVATLKAFEAAIDRMKEFIGVQPAVVAHDLHPDYFSTRYALAQADVRTVGVQHHHAHIVSAMAEHRMSGPVVGVAYDGTGYGTDGTSWGGEVLIATQRSFERFATFRPIPLPGGDQAIRQPWRVALALLDEAFDGEPPLHAIPLFRAVPRKAVDAVRRMVARNFNTTPARGIGRYFDAFGALILGLGDARYEGEVAFRWNMIAGDDSGRYPVVVRDGEAPWEVDLRPTVKAAIDDLIAGTSASVISARFHNSLASVTIELARAALSLHGEMPVVLSGGCFQNARLTESIVDALPAAVMNRVVPPGDGGIALGQAIVADALLRHEDRKTVAQEIPVCA